MHFKKTQKIIRPTSSLCPTIKIFFSVSYSPAPRFLIKTFPFQICDHYFFMHLCFSVFLPSWLVLSHAKYTNYEVQAYAVLPIYLQSSLPFYSKYSSQHFGLKHPKICVPCVRGETKDLHKYSTKITVFIN